jgi:hypothetical protein
MIRVSILKNLAEKKVRERACPVSSILFDTLRVNQQLTNNTADFLGQEATI